MTVAYHFLATPLGAEHIPNMLGRFAVFPSSPFLNSAPRIPVNPQDIATIHKPTFKEVAATQFAYDHSRKSGIASIPSLLSLAHVRIAGDMMSVRGEKMQTYEMVQSIDTFRELTANESCKRDIHELMKWGERKECYMVIGMLTVTGLTVYEKQVGKDHSNELMGGVPLSLAGVAPVDVEAGATVSRRSSCSSQGEVYEEETIIAVAYHVVTVADKWRRREGKFAWYREKKTKIHINRKTPGLSSLRRSRVSTSRFTDDLGIWDPDAPLELELMEITEDDTMRSICTSQKRVRDSDDDTIVGEI